MAAKTKSKPPGDAYYDAMIASKRAAGLSLEQATEVTARQRAEDEANGLTIDEAEAAADQAPPAE